MKLWESGRLKPEKEEKQKKEEQKETQLIRTCLKEEETKRKNSFLSFFQGLKRKAGKAAGRIGRFAKKHKILTILIILILIAAIAASVILRGMGRRPQFEETITVETAAIERMDLSNSIGVTGTLATAEGRTGTTTLDNIKVTEVYVEVGDEVQEGDIICTFDSSDIESALADAENNYAVNQQLDALENYETEYADTIEEAEDSLQDARDTRDAYKNVYENAAAEEEDALNTLNEVKSQYNMENLKSVYDSAKEVLKEALEQELRASSESTASGGSGETEAEESGAQEQAGQVQEAEAAEEKSAEGTAENASEGTAESTAENTAESTQESTAGTENTGNQEVRDGYQILDLETYLSSITAIPDSCSATYEDYQSAKTAYESAQKAISDAQAAYEQAQANTSSAYGNYEQAQSQKESVQEQHDATVEQAQETYEKAKLEDQLVREDDARNQIEQYEEQLEDCTVYASMTGTITALNVEAGGVFTGGSIYEIQDVHNFIVEATVDEYDVVDIKEGQTAYVVTDSLGDEELEGVVTYVSPVGTSGQTMGSASGTASYEIQITINEPQEKLRSGMTASVSIALEESKDTLAVPYDCVQTNEAGESVIYVEDNGERKEIAVETGIETDYYIEVISDEISEGMTVYLNTPLLQSGGAGALPDAGQTGEEGTMEFDFGGGMPSGAPSGGGMPSGGSMPSGGPSGGGMPGGF